LFAGTRAGTERVTPEGMLSIEGETVTFELKVTVVPVTELNGVEDEIVAGLLKVTVPTLTKVNATEMVVTPEKVTANEGLDELK
jgi:hypothetical protein